MYVKKITGCIFCARNVSLTVAVIASRARLHPVTKRVAAYCLPAVDIGICNRSVKIFEFFNPLIGIFIHLPVMKFQNTFLANFQKRYLIFKAGFEK